MALPLRQRPLLELRPVPPPRHLSRLKSTIPSRPRFALLCGVCAVRLIVGIALAFWQTANSTSVSPSSASVSEVDKPEEKPQAMEDSEDDTNELDSLIAREIVVHQVRPARSAALRMPRLPSYSSQQCNSSFDMLILGISPFSFVPKEHGRATPGSADAVQSGDHILSRSQPLSTIASSSQAIEPLFALAMQQCQVSRDRAPLGNKSIAERHQPSSVEGIVMHALAAVGQALNVNGAETRQTESQPTAYEKDLLRVKGPLTLGQWNRTDESALLLIFRSAMLT